MKFDVPLFFTPPFSFYIGLGCAVRKRRGSRGEKNLGGPFSGPENFLPRRAGFTQANKFAFMGIYPYLSSTNQKKTAVLRR